MLFNDIIQSYQHVPYDLEQVIEQFAALKVPNNVSMQAAADGYELLIYDCIGCGGIEADDVVQALALAGGAPIRVRINSPGGDAFEAFAIYNVLAAYPGDVTVVVDGVCASGAAYLAMAADRIEMQPASFLMIHNGWTMSIGDKSRFGTVIKALTRIDQAQAQIFATKSGMTAADVQAMLDAETWFSADEAVKAGLADSIVNPADLTPLPQLPSDPDEAEDAAQDEQMMPNMQATEDVEAGAELLFAFEKRRRMLQARLLSIVH